MSFFSSGPPEILSQVFQSCNDFVDVLALATTCKRVNSIWLSNMGNITWNVGRNSVLSFDEALIATRASSIVYNAFIAGKLPPEISIPSLSGTVQKPTLLDVKATLDLRHFARYMEHLFLLPEKTETSFGRGAKPFLDESPHLLPILQENFHRALYRFFIVGAVLNRAYQEPFHSQTEETPDGFLIQAKHAIENESDHYDDQIHEVPMSVDEIEYLTKMFPIYDFTPREDWEDCFGHLGDWLVGKKGNRSSFESNTATETAVNGDEPNHAALREIMQLLVMFGQLMNVAGGLFARGEPFWVTHRRRSDGGCICMKDMPSESPEEEESEEEDEEGAYGGNDSNGQQADPNSRKIPAVFFGTFEVCMMTMKAGNPNFDMEGPNILEIDIPEPNNAVAPQLPLVPIIEQLCDMLWCASPRPNTVNGHPSPHPPLHFFTFILRKHFGYQFDELAFDMDLPEPIYYNFIRRGKIFTDEGEWESMLTSLEPEQTLSSVGRGWSVYTHW